MQALKHSNSCLDLFRQAEPGPAISAGPAAWSPSGTARAGRGVVPPQPVTGRRAGVWEVGGRGAQSAAWAGGRAAAGAAVSKVF